VVVNCAGRTRSIIGCQSLRNAGIPNPVVALKDGTMGWQLAGFECEHGAARVAPPPGAEGARKARERAEGVAQRFKVGFVSFEELKRMEQDKGRTLYLLDVRSREEFEERRLAGSRHAPGGQLVQATDEYVGVRNSRLVLVDPARVRSVMTASWLLQMGWKDVHVLEPEGEDGFGGRATEAGPGRMSAAVRMFPHTVSVDGLKESRSTIIDLSTSLHFRSRHIPGAWWAVRARLDEARSHVKKTGTDHDFPQSLVLTSEDGVLAHLAAPEAAALWPQAQLRVLEGGNAAWFAAGLPIETGLQRLSTANNDLWYKPYDHRTDFEKHAREYLSWEVDLAEQIKRDPAVRFYRPDPT
jgi:rhodanese-related sulfurtransferase